MTQKKHTIILIEDNPQDIELMSRVFSKLSTPLELRVAEDGEQALHLLSHGFSQGFSPALILLDIKLPKINGLDLLARFKKDANLKRIPIIIFSSSDQEKDIERAYALGVNSYIPKPKSYPLLKETIALITNYWLNYNLC